VVTPAISAEHPVAVFVGTRPEVIKLAPVVRELAARGVPYRLLSSGQHRELLDPILAAFELTPDRDLAVMTADQTLAGLSAALLRGIDGLLEELRPSWAVVQGDTTTVAMAALAAFYRRVRVAHVEAGLRTHVKDDPFPEEINRTLLGDLADLHLAPTAEAVRNLEREGVAPERLHQVGNTVIDALYAMVAAVRDRPLSDFDVPGLESLDLDGPDLESLDAGRALVLVTGHRRENLGGGFAGIFEGLARVARRLGDAVEIVYPVHLNPRVREQALAILGEAPRVRLVEPLAYPAFVRLMTAARLIVTDSGGVQEEAAALGIPTLVTRRTSERREAIDAGVAELVGVEAAAVEAAAVRLLTDDAYHRSRAVATDAFGDGKAAGRIVDALLHA
jgi:UDP-N-acetylglucosamine 2-epimerase (non-hydrolysing)